MNIAPRAKAIFGVTLALALFALNIAHGIKLGQDRIMYDPVYRWRESVVIALSRLRDEPSPSRYLGFGSLRDLFIRSGLAVLPPENSGAGPDMNAIRRIQTDQEFLDSLFQRALTVPIDPSRAPVVLGGNELGSIDYYYLAFRLFGVHVSSFYYFYYALLAISIVCFLAAARGSPIQIFILCIYLAGHYALLDYAVYLGPHIASVSNSRFFSAPALLPALHVLIVTLRRDRPTWLGIGAVVVQVALLAFYQFCRTEVTWEPLMLLGAGLFVIPYRRLGHLIRLRSFGGLGSLLAPLWATAIVVIGLVSLSLYTRAAPDARYADEAKAHIFWHELYMGTISTLYAAHPDRIAPYLYGQRPYEDNLVYLSVLSDMRARNDASSPTATVVDGVLSLDVTRSWAAYDRQVRSLMLRFIQMHPLLFLESFADKLVQEIVLLRQVYESKPPGERLSIRGEFVPLGAAIGASILLSLTGGYGAFRNRKAWLMTGMGMFVLVASSAVPVFVEPSHLLVGTILAWVMLIAGGLGALLACTLQVTVWRPLLGRPGAVD